MKGYGENLACQCQGNPLCLQIHCGVPAAEICLPANRENKIVFFVSTKALSSFSASCAEKEQTHNTGQIISQTQHTGIFTT